MRRLLIGLVVAASLGFLFDLSVFIFQLAQYGRIDANSRQTQCWAGVLDHAVTAKPAPGLHAELEREARHCATLAPRPAPH